MVPILTITDEVAAGVVAEALFRAADVHRERGETVTASFALELARSADRQRVALWEARGRDTTEDRANDIVSATAKR